MSLLIGNEKKAWRISHFQPAYPMNETWYKAEICKSVCGHRVLTMVGRSRCWEKIQWKGHGFGKPLLQSFLHAGQEDTMATHKLGLNFTMKSWTESLALHYEYWLCMALASSYLNYTVCNLYRPALSSLPLSVTVRSCHACVNLSRHCSRFLSRQRCILAVVLHWQQAGHKAIRPRTFIPSPWNI